MSAPTPPDQTAVPETLPEQGQGRIILCDVDGTLLLHGQGPGLQINEGLVEFLLAAQDRGYHTQIHSTVDQSMLQFKLLARKSPAWAKYWDRYMASCAPGDEDFIIVRKGDTPYEDAFVIVDDEIVNVPAPHVWTPKDPRIVATMAAWGLKAETAPVARADAAGGPLAGGPKQS